MASTNKTIPTSLSPDALIGAIGNKEKQRDAIRLLNIMKSITGEEPVVWGDSIIGFGTYHYTYPSGREGDYFLAGFSPRKKNFSIYIMAGCDRFPGLMEQLGTFRTGKSCLYVNRLKDIDESVLKELISASVSWMRETYPPA